MYIQSFPNGREGGVPSHQVKICSSPHLGKFPPVNQIFVPSPSAPEVNSPIPHPTTKKNVHIITQSKLHF